MISVVDLENMKDKARIMEAAIATYGEHAQIDMAIEEMSELTKALMKHRRATNAGESGDAERANIIEEIADVQIMLMQLTSIFGDYGDVTQMIDEKLARLKARFDERLKTVVNECAD